MSEARRSPIPFLLLVVSTFGFAALAISFAVTFNWALLGGAVPVAAVVAWTGKKVVT